MKETIETETTLYWKKAEEGEFQIAGRGNVPAQVRNSVCGGYSIAFLQGEEGGRPFTRNGNAWKPLSDGPVLDSYDICQNHKLAQ